MILTKVATQFMLQCLFQTDAKMGLILNAGQIAKTTKAASHDLERRLAHYMRDGSGWTFGRIQSFLYIPPSISRSEARLILKRPGFGI